LKGEQYVNQIINQTGLYKDHVRNDLKTLHEARLIEDKVKNYVWGVRRMKQLTELGKELATMQYGVDMFQKYFDILQRKVHTINDLAKKDPTVVEKILKDRQWKKHHIDNREEWAQSAQELLGYTLRLFTDALMVRYTKITSRFNLNELAKSMLVEVVKDAIAAYLLSRPSKRCLKCGAINIDEESERRRKPISLGWFSQPILLRILFSVIH
jgi:predicted transcriptional regulator